MGILHRIPITPLLFSKFNAWVKVKVQHKTGDHIILHGCYWPNAGKADHRLAREEFSTQLHTITEEPTSCPLISGGDFNARLQTLGDNQANVEGRILWTIMLSNNLFHLAKDVHIMTGGSTRRQPMHYADGSSTILNTSPDNVFATIPMLASIRAATVHDTSLGSDHMIMDVVIDATSSACAPPKETRFIMDLKDANMEALSSSLNDERLWVDSTPTPDQFEQPVLAAANETCRRLATTRVRPFKPLPPAVVHAYDHLNKLQRRCRQDDYASADLVRALADAKEKVKRLISSKERVQAIQRKQMMSYTQKEGRRFWKSFNALRATIKKAPTVIRRPDGSETQTQEELIEEWTRHFSALGILDREDYQFFDPMHKETLDQEFEDIIHRLPPHEHLDADILPKQVYNIIKNLKKGKAPGPDSILNEFLKAGIRPDTRWFAENDTEEGWRPSPFLSKLTDMLNGILLEGTWPENWRQGMTPVLYKKGDPLDMGNYRGLTYLSVVSKLLLAILAQRIRDYLELHDRLSEEQLGFRKTRSCTEQAFNLYQILATRKASGKTSYMAFLDLAKAYDMVWRQAALVKLARSGITGKIWKILKSSYESITRRMHPTVAPEASNLALTYALHRGLPQGANESPIRFDVYIDDLAKELNERGIGVPVGGARVGSLLFADDVAIIAATESELRVALLTADAYARKWRLKFNPSPKSAVMRVGGSGRWDPQRPMFIGTHNLSVTRQYRYLGLQLCDDLRWGKHVDAITQSASKVIGMIKNLSYRNGNWTPRVLVRLFDALVRPILEYGCEVWAPCLTLQ